MPAAVYDFVIEQGANKTIQYYKRVVASPLVCRDWSDYDRVQLQIRKNYKSEEILADLTLTAHITVKPHPTTDQVGALIEIVFPAAVTAALPATLTTAEIPDDLSEQKHLVYDLEAEILSLGYVERLMTGKIYVSPEVTRDE